MEAVAQDVFIEAQAALDRYDPSRPLGTWLRTIVTRRAIDYLRSPRHRREAPADLKEDMMPADTRPDPERHAELANAQRILVELLGELRDDLRAVFVMHEIEQLTIPVIAEMLGVNENTVRSRLHRARQAFDEAHRRRGGTSGSLPAVAPLALLEAGRAPFADLDPAMAARIWGRLVRMFGVGIVDPLAPLSSAQIAAGAAMVFILGVGAGLALHPVLRPAPPAARIAAGEVVAPGAQAAASAAPAATPSLDLAASAAPASAPASAGPADAQVAGVRDQPDTLRLEQRIIDRAWRLLGDGDVAGASRELRNHEKLYPSGALTGRRRALQREILDREDRSGADRPATRGGR